MIKYDTHHLLYPKHDWNSGAARKLRTHKYCMVEIPKDTLHVRIHKAVGFVPVPSESMLRDALKQIRLMEEYGAIHDNDPAVKKIAMLIALFDCMAPDTTEAIKNQLDVIRDYEKALGK